MVYRLYKRSIVRLHSLRKKRGPRLNLHQLSPKKQFPSKDIESYTVFESKKQKLKFRETNKDRLRRAQYHRGRAKQKKNSISMS